VQPALESVRRSIAVFGAVAVVAASIAPTAARAEIDAYHFSGTVSANSTGILFLGKSAGTPITARSSSTPTRLRRTPLSHAV